MSTPAPLPGPTFIFSISAFRPATTWSPVSSPIATTSGIAMQRSPHEPYAAPISAFTALPMSASGITTAKFFAPPSACTRLPCAQPVE